MTYGQEEKSPQETYYEVTVDESTGAVKVHLHFQEKRSSVVLRKLNEILKTLKTIHKKSAFLSEKFGGAFAVKGHHQE